jgi:ribonuclease BN (tRNA processing enzyme)
VTGEPLSLTVLGCDGSYPGPGGSGSGYLVRCGTTKVWVDAGPGTLANLQRYVDIEDLDAVVISHSHPDHWSDLDHFAVAARWVIGRPPLPVYAAEGVRELMRVGVAAEVLDWRPIEDGHTVAVGPMDFSFSQTDHPVTTLAVRVDGGGRSLGYSADSGPGWGLSALGPGLNLALCEATFLSDLEDSGLSHMSAREAGRTARHAGVERLVIIHLWPRVDRAAAKAEAEEAFGGEVTLAAMGDRYVA